MPRTKKCLSVLQLACATTTKKYFMCSAKEQKQQAPLPHELGIQVISIC